MNIAIASGREDYLYPYFSDLVEKHHQVADLYLGDDQAIEIDSAEPEVVLRDFITASLNKSENICILNLNYLEGLKDEQGTMDRHKRLFHLTAKYEGVYILNVLICNADDFNDDAQYFGRIQSAVRQLKEASAAYSSVSSIVLNNKTDAGTTLPAGDLASQLGWIRYSLVNMGEEYLQELTKRRDKAGSAFTIHACRAYYCPLTKHHIEYLLSLLERHEARPATGSFLQEEVTRLLSVEACHDETKVFSVSFRELLPGAGNDSRAIADIERYDQFAEEEYSDQFTRDILAREEIDAPHSMGDNWRFESLFSHFENIAWKIQGIRHKKQLESEYSVIANQYNARNMEGNSFEYPDTISIFEGIQKTIRGCKAILETPIKRFRDASNIGKWIARLIWPKVETSIPGEMNRATWFFYLILVLGFLVFLGVPVWYGFLPLGFQNHIIISVVLAFMAAVAFLARTIRKTTMFHEEALLKEYEKLNNEIQSGIRKWKGARYKLWFSNFQQLLDAQKQRLIGQILNEILLKMSEIESNMEKIRSVTKQGIALIDLSSSRYSDPVIREQLKDRIETEVSTEDLIKLVYEGRQNPYSFLRELRKRLMDTVIDLADQTFQEDVWGHLAPESNDDINKRLKPHGLEAWSKTGISDNDRMLLTPRGVPADWLDHYKPHLLVENEMILESNLMMIQFCTFRVEERSNG